jgi:hypothetical protein
MGPLDACIRTPSRCQILSCPFLPLNSQAWSHLVSLDLGNNEFSGALPDPLFRIPLLTYLDVSHNQ